MIPLVDALIYVTIFLVGYLIGEYTARKYPDRRKNESHH